MTNREGGGVIRNWASQKNLVGEGAGPGRLRPIKLIQNSKGKKPISKTLAQGFVPCRLEKSGGEGED